MVPSTEEIRRERKLYDESVRKFREAFASFGLKAEAGKITGEDVTEHLGADIAFAKAAQDHNQFLSGLIDELLGIRGEEAQDKK